MYKGYNRDRQYRTCYQYSISSLTSFKFYYVEVVAENGVSNQLNNQERKVSASLATNPGSETRIILCIFCAIFNG